MRSIYDEITELIDELRVAEKLTTKEYLKLIGFVAVVKQMEDSAYYPERIQKLLQKVKESE